MLGVTEDGKPVISIEPENDPGLWQFAQVPSPGAPVFPGGGLFEL